MARLNITGTSDHILGLQLLVWRRGYVGSHRDVAALPDLGLLEKWLGMLRLNGVIKFISCCHYRLRGPWVYLPCNVISTIHLANRVRCNLNLSRSLSWSLQEPHLVLAAERSLKRWLPAGYMIAKVNSSGPMRYMWTNIIWKPPCRLLRLKVPDRQVIGTVPHVGLLIPPMVKICAAKVTRSIILTSIVIMIRVTMTSSWCLHFDRWICRWS